MPSSGRGAAEADGPGILKRSVTRIGATALGLGYSPLAPGTAGTLLPFAALLIAGVPDTWVLVAAAMAVYAIGVPLSTWGEAVWGGEDPGQICIDEVAGYLVAVALVPAHSETAMLVAAFFLFRLFDIVKLPPARLTERLPRGWGVMTDDVVAGLHTNIVLQIAARLDWL